jgi:CRP-like cAMP-binding protein
VFGEIALTDRSARSADVMSLGSGSLLVIEREAVMSVADASPALGWALARIVSRRLRRLTERLEDRAFLDLEARLAKRLVEAAEDVSGTADAPLMPGLCVALTQRDLAELVDGSRERVNKRLAQWTTEGLIAVDRARITILEPGKLRQVYGPTAPKRT